MKDQGSGVRSYIETDWAGDGVEVVSSGDTSVTVTLPQRLAIGSLISELISRYDAECDLMLTQRGAALLISYSCDVQIETQRNPATQWLVTVVLAMLYAHMYMYSKDLRDLLLNYTGWHFA